MGMLRKGLMAGGVSLAITLVMAQVAKMTTGVPEGFPPFTFAPLAVACLGSALLGTGCYALLRRITRFSKPLFIGLSFLTVVTSLALPYRLGYTQSQRFAGATPAAQLVLVLMHGVVAGIVTFSLLRRDRTMRELED